MANHRCTYQQVTNVSINKSKIIEIATNFGLSEIDLRVLLLLFTELNGWSDINTSSRTVDPENYTKVDVKTIADTLGYKKKKVKNAMDNLISAGLLEQGSNDRVQDGWRFTF